MERIKSVVTSAISFLGYEIRRKVERRKRITRMTKQDSLELLKELGLVPQTVIDVGVQFGTEALFKSFPDAKHVLIEPVKEFAPEIRRVYSGFKDVEFVWAAASNQPGTSLLSVTSGLKSSNLGVVEGRFWVKELMREVHVVTLDEVCRERNARSPYLIKIDTDGKDLDVLEGATHILPQTSCIVIESTIYQLSERLRMIEKLGFFLWDIVELGYKKDVLFQMDLIFLHKKFEQDVKVLPWSDDEILFGRSLHFLTPD